MYCPSCSGKKLNIIDSRDVKKNNQTKRRRICLECGYRFTTVENLDIPPIEVLKDKNIIEQFNSEILKNSIFEAFKDNGKSNIDTIKNITETLTDKFTKLSNDTPTRIKTSDIIEDVLKCLAQIDELAFIKYALKYANITDVSQLSSLYNRSK